MPFAGLSSGLAFQHTKSGSNTYRSNKFGFFLAPEAEFLWWLSNRAYFDLKARYDLIHTIFPNHHESFNVNFGIGFKITR